MSRQCAAAVGANGPLFAITKEFQPVALKRGIKLELRAYTDEKVAAEDFKAGLSVLDKSRESTPDQRGAEAESRRAMWPPPADP